jgi:G:T-mismatch repair DNA endonuclease (very short patch repair protein)
VEQKFFEDLSSLYPDITQKTLRYQNTWLFPDIITVDDLVVIEFYGNFWHANPSMYKPDDIAGHNMLAKDIWQRDDERLCKLYELGHSVYIVWEDDYKNFPKDVLIQIDRLLNWETCCL